MLGQKLWVELDISGLVHTVNISECSSNGEVRRDGGESSVDIIDVLGLSVKSGIVDTSVVNTIFLTTSNTDFLSCSVREIFGSYDVNIPSLSTVSLEQLFGRIFW